jgi:hypothetical protein
MSDKTNERMTERDLTALASQTAEKYFGIILDSRLTDVERAITVVDINDVNDLAKLILEALQTALAQSSQDHDNEMLATLRAKIAKMPSVMQKNHSELSPLIYKSEVLALFDAEKKP